MPDFRSQKMPSPEGLGLAQSRWRKAWDAYIATISVVTNPVFEPATRKLVARMTTDALGFWMLWHLEGGFEGLQRLGMSRSGIYRRISTFRRITGKHPDEFQMPGVTLDVEAYLKYVPSDDGTTAEPDDSHPSRTIRD